MTDLPHPRVPPSDVHATVTYVGRSRWLRRPQWLIEVVDEEHTWIPFRSFTFTGPQADADTAASKLIDAYLTANRAVHTVYGSSGPATGRTGPAGQCKGA